MKNYVIIKLISILLLTLIISVTGCGSDSSSIHPVLIPTNTPTSIPIIPTPTNTPPVIPTSTIPSGPTPTSIPATGTAPANGKSTITVSVVITPPTGVTVAPLGQPVVFRVISGNAIFLNGLTQITANTVIDPNVPVPGGSAIAETQVVSNIAGTSRIVAQYQDQRTYIDVTFGQARLYADLVGIPISGSAAISLVGGGAPAMYSLYVSTDPNYTIPVEGATVQPVITGSSHLSIDVASSSDQNGNIPIIFTNTMTPDPNNPGTEYAIVSLNVTAPAPYNQTVKATFGGTQLNPGSSNIVIIGLTAR